MSSVALQDAVVAALLADAAVAGFVGMRVHDNPPPDTAYPHISLGPAQGIPLSLDCIEMSEEYLQIDVWTRENGSTRGCKEICAAVKRALHGVALALDDPAALASLAVEQVLVMGDPDEQIAHGVIQLAAEIETHG
ncbi:MAG: DUF3168 domain-containing protein [Sphingomonadales bacterium]|nr:DUF3168 domain-containing protein [Sphingomonadales bacterium]